MPQDHTLTGKKVLAISIGFGLGDAVIEGLRDSGASIERIGAELDTSTQAGVLAGVGSAIERLGVPEIVIINVIPDAAMTLANVAELPETEWRAVAMDGLRTCVRLLQAIGPHMKPAGGAIVFVAPSLSLVGAKGMVALSTLLEGQRGLVKSVARQWGASGVTLNWIAAAPRALSSAFDDIPLTVKPDAVTVALGRAPDPRGEIAPVIGFLASPAGRVITGATLMLDGGEWMVP